MIDDKVSTEIAELIGAYLIENAEDLIPIMVSDMSKDTFTIVIRRRKKEDDPCPISK